MYIEYINYMPTDLSNSLFQCKKPQVLNSSAIKHRKLTHSHIWQDNIYKIQEVPRLSTNQDTHPICKLARFGKEAIQVSEVIFLDQVWGPETSVDQI